jgi:hypothetical protein
VNTSKDSATSVDRRESKAHAALIAAYRDGLGLAAIAIIRDATGVRIATFGNASDCTPSAGEQIETRWWCRRSADAARVAAAATARLRRDESKDIAAVPVGASCSAQRAGAAIAAAAKQCGVTLYSEAETAAAAMAMIARVDEEIEQLQRTGELKSVNRSYRSYRTETTARGEIALPYAQWFNQYKANLVRQLAAALRFS